MAWKIEDKPGVEIYISDVGFICMKQRQFPDDDQTILIHPTIIEEVIAMLCEAKEEAVATEAEKTL